MKSQADQTPENKSQAVANGLTKPSNTGESTSLFVDNRPEAVAQRKLQQVISNSTLTSQNIQRKEKKSEEEEILQGKFEAGENKTGMPDALKSGIESLSGMSMDHVKVHYNSAQPAQLHALAYAQGSNIHLAPGQEQHLPHEAWHVVQQAQGRVKPTMQMKAAVPINDDAGLEQEADRMGAMALHGGPVTGDGVATTGSSKSVQRRRVSRGGGRSVAQLVAPGGIEHATNSCFAAALINTFTVVRPLRNLLIPTNNVLVNQQALALQNLLWRAVNTVDASVLLPRSWVRRIMVSLVQNHVIPSAVSTADFSQVMGLVVGILSNGNENAGQGNGMPTTTGEVAWHPGESLETVVGLRVQQMQGQAVNYNLTPNSIHVTRSVGNAGFAPQTFNLYPANNTVVNYRLRSVVEHSDKYVGGHFVSRVDRGDGGQEWWRSDDLHPDDVEASDLGTGNMQRQGYAYIYERSDAALADNNGLAQVDEEVQPVLQEFYEKDLRLYLKQEMGSKESESSIKLDEIDLNLYDKNTREKVEDRSMTHENVGIKIKEFNKCGELELEEMGRVNTLLKEYSRVQTVDMYETAQQQMLQARAKIKIIHKRQAELLGHYMDEGSTEEAKQAFLQGIIPGFQKTDVELFDRIAGRLPKREPDKEPEKESGDKSDVVVDKSDVSGESEKETPEDKKKREDALMLLRNRYLVYIAQGLGTATGRGRLEEFGGLLGKRNIQLGSLGGEFGAGFGDEETDNPKAQKDEVRKPGEDQKLFETGGGNILTFIEQRFGKMLRTAGKTKDDIGDLAVFLEGHMDLFPIFLGMSKTGGVEFFSSPLFTAMHHETGHLVNYLKGTSGGKNKYRDDDDGPLKKLTDEEEVYNISIDQYSDKAMTDEMGLPGRIAHKSHIGLDEPSRQSEGDVYGLLDTWKGLTGQEKEMGNPLRELQVKIGQLNIADKQFHQKQTTYLAEVTEWLIHQEAEKALPEEDRQRLADAIAWCLDSLEHKVYNRMTAYQRQVSMVKPDNPEFVALGDDLDQIQVEHRKYIAYIVGAKLKLWVQGSDDEKQAANRDWEALLGNKKGIRIDEEASPEFKNETQANIAKLLSRKNGRKLVHALMSSGNALEISTPDPERVDKIREYYKSQGMSGKKLDETVNGTFGGQAGPTNSPASTAQDGSKGFERNSGSRSTMAMRTGLKDSEGASMDRGGKLILSPNFIEMGHEMIHALHNIRGANVKGKKDKDYQGSAWDNMSEHSVIDGTDEMEGLLDEEYVTENLLREDHNLGERYGHNSAVILKEAILPKLLAIAQKTSWDKLGGGIFSDKTPEGIVTLRNLLVQNPVNWKAVKLAVQDRAKRNGAQKFFMAVPKQATEFYIQVDQFCDLLGGTDVMALRQLLDDIK